MEVVPSPNNRMERGGMNKLLGRGRPAVVPKQVSRARVPQGQRAARSCERSATAALNLHLAHGVVQSGHEAHPPV
jgi:hypothetical protein